MILGLTRYQQSSLSSPGTADTLVNIRPSMPTHTWNGHTIEVGSYATPRLLWFSIGFSVLVDNSPSFHSPEHVEGFRTNVPFEIRDADTVRRGRVESGRPCSVLRAFYRVFLDEQEIASGVVRARNWYVTYGIMLAVAILISCLLYVALAE